MKKIKTNFSKKNKIKNIKTHSQKIKKNIKLCF